MAATNVRPMPGRHLTGKVEDHQTLTGNQILIQVEGRTIGRVQNMTARESFGTEPLYEVGSMLPAELVPLQWRGTLSIDKYRLKQDAVEGLGLAFGEDVLKKNLFDVVIINKATGSIVEKFAGCVQADLGGNYPANRPATQNVTFLFQEHIKGDAVTQATAQ